MKRLFKSAGSGHWIGLLLLVMAPLVLIMAASQVADYDFWWHINLGRQIWQNGTPVVVDAFSYTCAGQPQLNSEWLADLLLYASYAGAGWNGVFLFKALALFTLLALVAAAVLELHERRDRTLFLALFTGELLLLFALRFRLFPRPFLFSYLGLAALLWLLLRHRRTGDERLLWLVPGVTLFWANLSVGVFFAPLICGLYLLATIQAGRWRWMWLGVLTATLLATLVNPDGFGLYRYLFDRVFHARGSVLSENLPLSAQLLWGGGWKYTAPYQLMVVLTAAGLAFVMRTHRFFLGLLTLLCFVFSLRQVRMVDFFCIVASIPVVLLFVELLQRWSAWARSTRAYLVVGALLLLATSALALNDGSYRLGFGFKETAMPRGALAFLERERLTGPLFNSNPCGGYVAWTAPARQVFIDGRNDHLYPSDALDNYFALIHSAQAWSAAEQRWGFEIAVLEYDLLSFGRHFPAHLITNPGWALVYWDTHSAVYLKRIPRFAALIERCAYRLVRPSFYNFDYLAEARAQLPPTEALALTQADVRRNPDNQEVRLALVALLYGLDRRGFGPLIRRELEICLTLPPDLAMEHAALGMVQLEAGERDAALRETRAALALDPTDRGALFLKKKFGL